MVLMSTWLQTEAERAFGRATRSRRRARLMRRVRRVCACCDRLAIASPMTGRQGGRGVREIPLERIHGTLEPNRAEQFDYDFRPDATVRERWQRVWVAEARGTVLPPIQVVPTDDGYAVRDGHHRVSVALARGAVTIDALVGAG
jgi:hypothetical protein